jgi:hypothetical protein
VKKLFALVLIACVAVVGCKKKPSETGGSGSSKPSTQTVTKKLTLDPATVEIEAGKSADVKVSIKEGDKKVKATEEMKIEIGEAKGDAKATAKTSKIAKDADEGTVTIEVAADAEKGKTSTIEIKAGGMTEKVNVKVK